MRQLILQRFGTVSRNYIGRYCSSFSLPPNLQISDPKLLFEEAPKPIIPSVDYFFPLMEVPKSMKVNSFQNPGMIVDGIEAELDSRVFGVAIRKDIVHEMIRYQRAKKRQPKKTKRISEISGSNKKPRPQKGTGSSQVGHKRNTAWRGGAKAHGPVIRDYSIGLNRKVRAMAMMITLAAKFREGNLIVFDNMGCTSHRTKDLSSLLKQHGLLDVSASFVDDDLRENFQLASRNMPLLKSMNSLEANVYDVVRCEKLAITAAALAAIQERLVAQYTHSGKRKSLLAGLAGYQAMAALGSSLQPTKTEELES